MSWFGRKVAASPEMEPTLDALRRAESLSPLGREVVDRVWHPRPLGDMSDPREVNKWAMGVRRPGESCAETQYMVMINGQCDYIARCVAIAEELQRAGPEGATLARRVLLLREEREQLRLLAQQLMQMAGAIGAVLNKHDANVVAGVWGPEPKAEDAVPQ